MRITNWLLLSISLVAVSLPASAASSQTAAPSTISVTFLLENEFSSPGLDAVVRRDMNAETNVIAIRRAALSPELVYHTLRLLSSLAGRQPNPLGLIDVRVPSSRRPANLTPDKRSEMADLVAKVRAAALRDIPRIGRVPALTISIPTLQ